MFPANFEKEFPD